jgi:protein-disulfide isomerase
MLSLEGVFAMINRRIAVVSLIVVVSQLAFANDQLALVMKQMKKDFKALSTQVSDLSKNSASVQLAQDLEVQLKKAHDLVPDSVAQLQGPEKASALTEYQNQIQDTEAQAEKLVSSLQAGDNNGAAAVLNKINDMKKSGHEKFDPN